MKLPPWFPGNVKPARPGVYQRKGVAGYAVTYSMWDGRRWLLSSSSRRFAADHHRMVSGWTRAPWRGLAERPKEKA